VADEVVLVVEDEGAVRNIMARTLRECGYTVLEAAHGLQALEILERHGVSVTLIIADVVMPQISARELAERVLERWPEVPILLPRATPVCMWFSAAYWTKVRSSFRSRSLRTHWPLRFVRCWTLGSLAPLGNFLLL
jgi:DNA-binding NtrC family response regulator